MNPILQSFLNIAFTQNGAVSNASTGNQCLNLFSKIGSMRNAPEAEIEAMFKAALIENFDTAIRIMLWTRDCRGGAGERRAFRTMLRVVDSSLNFNNAEQMGLMAKILAKTSELGRWDDVFSVENFFDVALLQWSNACLDPNRRELALKWAPREKSAKKNLARKIMKGLGLTPREYRKVVSDVVTTETMMCSNSWDQINLNHVPSVAAARYQKAFEKNHPGYAGWKAGLEDGTSKVNASVSYPYDVLRSYRSGVDSSVLQALWDALPNFIEEGKSILPIVDVSSSMTCRSGAEGLSCMDISISLGAYLADKNTGPFKGGMITFHSSPTFYQMAGPIGLEFQKIRNLPWDGSTNFVKSLELLLNHAKNSNASQEDFPQVLLCLSDMQFNRAGSLTNFEAVKKMYDEAGYKLPKIVFWNLNGPAGKEYPAKEDDYEVALVSGFSPAIMKTLLSGVTFTPIDVMMEAIGSDRYKVL